MQITESPTAQLENAIEHNTTLIEEKTAQIEKLRGQESTLSAPLPVTSWREPSRTARAKATKRKSAPEFGSTPKRSKVWPARSH
jgi:hypothetical protein